MKKMTEEELLIAISCRYNSEEEYFDAGEDVGYLLQVLSKRDRRIASLERLYDAVSNWRHGLIDKQTGLEVSSIACTYPAVWRLATTFDQLEGDE